MLLMKALGYGLLSASGLLLGALVSMFTKPTKKITAVIMAFGSGTLISAVAFDLCVESFEKGGPHALTIGFIFGGIVFVGSGYMVDNAGGFMRKYATRKRFLLQKKMQLASRLLGELSQVDIFHAMPPDEVQAILPFVEKVHFNNSDVVFHEGDEGDALYLIHDGRVSITSERSGHSVIAALNKGETFGEMAILLKEKRAATAVAETPAELYRIKQKDFQQLLTQFPKLSSAVHELVAKRLESAATKKIVNQEAAKQWKEKALAGVHAGMTSHEEKALMEQHAPSNASISIFLGALIDGIPESIVIGASLLAGASVGISFIAAVFLSNFPEGMSSSVGMKESGFSNKKIFLLWFSLVVFSGIASLLGNLFFAHASAYVIAVIQALAAGGILAMLANTMMPEAFELGGPLVAFATLAGFLSAFLMSALTHH